MRYLSILGVLAVLHGKAQHCAYDLASVIVVRPHAFGDTAVIDGLRITLLDSTNLPMTYSGWSYPAFIQNMDASSFEHDMLNHRPQIGADRIFPFAKDSYVLVVPSHLRTAGMKVLVQDERDHAALNKRQDRWPVRYEQVVVPLTAFDSYRLCGAFDDEVYPLREGRPNFAPVDITLHPR